MTTLLDEYGIRDVPEVEIEQQPAQIAAISNVALTEFEHANVLAETLPPIKTCGGEWFAYEDGAWGKLDRARFRPAAQKYSATSNTNRPSGQRVA